MFELLAAPVKIKGTPIPVMPSEVPMPTISPRFMMAGGVTMFFFSLLFLAYVIFWIWTLVSVLSNKYLDGINKLLWFLVIIILPVLGPILYLFIGHKQKASR